LTQSEALDLERFKHSRSSTLIKEISMGLFIDELLKGMIMLGMKGERLPSESEMVNMYKSVIDEYQNLKIGEMALAFDLAAKGKLDIEVETYQNFSVLYLHRILRSFARYGTQKITEMKPKQEESKWQPREVLDDEKVALAFECYKKFKQWDNIAFGIDSFKILYNRGMLKFNSVEIVKEVKELMTAKMMKSHTYTKQDIRALMEDDDYMEHQCYRLVLYKYFDSL
jgi:hypothetical protein